MGHLISLNPPEKEDVGRPDPQYGCGGMYPEKLNTIYSGHALSFEQKSPQPHARKLPYFDIPLLVQII